MTLKLFWAAPITSAVIPVSLISIQPIWNNELRLATYQSYISDEVSSDAYKKFGIKTTFFENDREVLNGFRSGSYDLAIVSSSTLEEAITQNLVKKIDWSKLNSILEKYKSQNSDQKPFSDELFSPIINYIFLKNPKLYEFGIPYFLSYLAFVYTGEKFSNNSELNWENLLETISKDERFLPDSKNSPKLAFIEDELTIFYISKLVEKSEQQLKNSGKFDFYNKLSSLTQKNKLGKLGPGSIFLHPNSALISEMMSSGELNGAFMYNGDALYTYKTMKEESKEVDLERKFHIFEGAPSLWLLDSIAISSKISVERENEIYKFLDELIFKGVVENKNSDWNIDFNSWAWQNFDYLKYTPTLKSLQKKIKSLEKQQKDRSDKFSDLSLEFDQKSINTLFGVQNLDVCKWGEVESVSSDRKEQCQVVFENSLGERENLQLALAFQRWKSNL